MASFSRQQYLSNQIKLNQTTININLKYIYCLTPPRIGEKSDWPPLKNDDFWLILPLFRGIFVNLSLTPLWIEKDA